MKLHFDDGRLTGMEYKHIRKEILGMSRRELAEELGVHIQTIYGREQKFEVKREYALALRMIWTLRHYDVPEMI